MALSPTSKIENNDSEVFSYEKKVNAGSNVSYPIPRYVLTDNMKSVVLHRDLDGRPVWQKDYEAFMRTVGFDTKLCKPRHPFTKGAVERLIRFVKENFLSDRVFCDVTDLNWQALEWCNAQNGIYHRAVDGVPQQIHDAACSSHLRRLPDSDEVRGYLCPNRRISFDGFVNYEGRRFGVPYSYAGSTARVMRSGDTLYIYSTDMNSLLARTALPSSWTNRYKYIRRIQKHHRSATADLCPVRPYRS